MTPRPPSPERTEATRARLMAAGVAAFGAKGFHATSTRDIAAAAGMSPAALYIHHRTKEELLHEISAHGHALIADLVASAATGPGSHAERLHRLVHDFVRHHAEAGDAARVVNFELRALSPEHHREIVAVRRRIEADVTALVEAGAEAGEFDVADARLCATALLSLGIDVSRWFTPGRAWDAEQVAEQYAGFALRIVGHRGA